MTSVSDFVLIVVQYLYTNKTSTLPLYDYFNLFRSPGSSGEGVVKGLVLGRIIFMGGPRLFER